MNPTTPAISVIIPSYNYAHLILESLQSVFAQTYHDYEIIVVDDGSTDNTWDVLKPFADRITYHRQENQGLAVARNTGLRLARGKYITYLDADDIWYPDNLRIKQENYNKYETTNIGSSTPQAANCTASTVVPMTYNRDDVEVGIDAMVASGPTVIPEGLAWGWRVISPTQPFTQVQGSGSIPAASISVYNDVRWKKIMVLMTDGDNDVGPGYYGYNNTTYTAYGHGGEALTTNRYGTTSADSSMTTTIDTTMNTICSKIKAENVTLYVASFGSGVSTATRTRLQNCATTGVGYYTHAETSSDLTAFFDHIGEDVINKSVYVSN